MSGIMYNVTNFKTKINNLINVPFLSSNFGSCKNSAKFTCESYKKHPSYKYINESFFPFLDRKFLSFPSFLNFSSFFPEKEPIVRHVYKIPFKYKYIEIILKHIILSKNEINLTN